MKKLFILAVLLILTVSLFSQGFFIRGSVSQDFAFMKTQFHSPFASIVGDTRINIHNNTFSETVSKGTYGKGKTYSISLGADINSHVGILIAVNYQKGSRVEDARLSIPNFIASQLSQSETVRVQPSVLISTGMDKRVSGYIKTGLTIPVWGSVNTTTSIEDMTGRLYTMLTNDALQGVSTIMQLESSTSGKPSIGLHSAVGLDLALSNTVSVFSEIQLTTLQIGLNETDLTAASGQLSIPGIPDIELGLDDLPQYFKTVHYADEITHESNTPQSIQNFNPNEPLEALDYGSNFNSLGIAIGLKIKI